MVYNKLPWFTLIPNQIYDTIYFSGGIYMKEKEKALSIRVDEDMYAKISFVAKKEGRTLNSQIKQFLEKGISRYEKEVEHLKKLDELEDEDTVTRAPVINQQELVG
jgi:predicted DNA-binding protein